MQRWKKLSARFSDMDYCTVPTVLPISESVYRVYFSSRSKDNTSYPLYVDYHVIDQKFGLAKRLNIELGNLGEFDEHGVMPCEVITKENVVYLYYVGWSRAVSVPFRNAIGLAISHDEGLTFSKYGNGPILDRSVFDTCFVASCCVIPMKENHYLMYYLSCNGWSDSGQGIEHNYNIKIAESQDAIFWKPLGRTAIDFYYPGEFAISTPRVVRMDGLHMWYSYRNGPKGSGYRIRYAKSSDGYVWKRLDSLVGLDVNPIPEQWDSEMICYPFLVKNGDELSMFYNGNGYGKTGIGLAVLKDLRA